MGSFVPIPNFPFFSTILLLKAHTSRAIFCRLNKPRDCPPYEYSFRFSESGLQIQIWAPSVIPYASCLDCPCARGKLPKPTSRVGQQAGRTPLSRTPTLGTAAVGPVTPAGRVGGARRTPRDFFPGEKRWSVDAMALSDKSGTGPVYPAS